MDSGILLASPGSSTATFPLCSGCQHRVSLETVWGSLTPDLTGTSFSGKQDTTRVAYGSAAT